MWRKTLLLMIAAVLLAGDAPAITHAASGADAVQGDGIYKPYVGAKYNLQYSVNNDQITITGIQDYKFQYRDLGELKIPDEIDGVAVTAIGDRAFFNCSGFTGNLVIPDGVTAIGQQAFDDCSGFTGNLVIPERVKTISDYAFRNCIGFTGDLVISDSVTAIGSHAFDGCSDFMGKLVISERVKTIGDYAFRNCSGFTGNLVISDSVTSIGSHAFDGCSGFTGDLVIPDSVTSIGSHAFHGCKGFTGELVISESVTSIDSHAFRGCKGFTGELVIPESVTSIGEAAFSYCSGFTGDLVIPESVTSIGEAAFSYCSGFTGDLVISDGVKTIGKSAFLVCSGFKGNLVIPGSVKTIGDNAFDGCHGFTGDLVIPDSVTSIGSHVFEGCFGFKGNLIIPESVTSIGEAAFMRCHGFRGNLIIPESVTSIGDRAFYACSGFTGDLVIPDSITAIGDYVFSDCDFVGDLVIPDSVVTIGDYAFNGCGFRGNLIIPDSVVTIGDYAFNGCGNFRGNLIIPESVTSVGDAAFFTKLYTWTSATFLGKDTRIGNQVFYYATPIYGYTGSTAEAYAKRCVNPFIPLPEAAEYYGDVNTELQVFHYDSSTGYLSGQIVVVEWVDTDGDGVKESTVPDYAPVMTFASTDGTESIEVFVTPTGTNTYYFDRLIDKLSPDKEFAFYVTSGNPRNISEYKTVPVYTGTSGIGSEGKLGMSKMDNTQSIRFKTSREGYLLLYGKDEGSYEGHVNSLLTDVASEKSAYGTFVSGHIVVTEWIDDVSTVPGTTPVMTFESYDGAEVNEVFMNCLDGTNTYYFDRNLSGRMDTKKEYIFRLSLTEPNNVSTRKTMVVTTNYMDEKEGLLWETDTQRIRYKTVPADGDNQLRVYAIDK